jgi:phospholipid/cholesterol/gamma-HCH transport system permease protein
LTLIKGCRQDSVMEIVAAGPGARLMGACDVDAPLLLTMSTTNDVVAFVASGAWVARNAGAIDALVDHAVTAPSNAGRVTLDMGGVREFDTYGAALLDRLVLSLERTGRPVEITGLSDRFVGLADVVRRAGRHGPSPERRKGRVLTALDAVERSLLEAGRDLSALLNMLGAIGAALGRVVAKPSTFRLTSTVHQIDRVAWKAVPIILLITFLIGGIIAQQGFFHFRKFGADQYVVDMVGILVLREIGVLIVAIMVAGRSGSSYTAELGSMKMREEIDALRTMGVDPVTVLLLPRLLALLIGLPILAFLGSMSALYGGGLVAWVYGDMSPDIFIARLRDAISITHFKVGMIKAPFMALAIGLVACVEGLKVRGSAESLGLQTTASVVKSIFLVIVLDGLFAMYFASIGM